VVVALRRGGNNVKISCNKGSGYFLSRWYRYAMRGASHG
jgi:uncharacterized protein YodC (DUF2158 family)